MTYQECVIVSAYTGYLMCDFDDMHKYIEEKMGRQVWTHELADKGFLRKLRETMKPDFLALCQSKKESKENA